MEQILVALRAQDFQESLKNTSAFGPKEVHFEKTLLIGKAATLAMHLRGLLFIADYDQLKYAAASLGIQSLELPAVLRELEAVDFISVARSGEIVRRIDIRVPEFRSGYKDLGARWEQLDPTEIENAGIVTLNSLFSGPQSRAILIDSLGLDGVQQSMMLDVMESGLLVATQTVDGQPMIYTPLAVDGNPAPYLAWAQKFPGEVATVIETLRKQQGLPLSDSVFSVQQAAHAAVQTGVLMPVKISGATGDQFFVFAPQGGLSQADRTVLDKSRAILACVRYGQRFAAGRPIRSPRMILERLRDYKRFKQGHPDLLMQYGLLTEKLIGTPVDEGNNRWNFEIYDTEENMKALNVALDMLDVGETPSARIDLEAQKALLTPSGYQGPATARPQLSRSIRSSAKTQSEIVRQMADLIRGVSTNG